jgi:hypothetical protein
MPSVVLEHACIFSPFSFSFAVLFLLLVVQFSTTNVLAFIAGERKSLRFSPLCSICVFTKVSEERFFLVLWELNVPPVFVPDGACW